MAIRLGNDGFHRELEAGSCFRSRCTSAYDEIIAPLLGDDGTPGNTDFAHCPGSRSAGFEVCRLMPPGALARSCYGPEPCSANDKARRGLRDKDASRPIGDAVRPVYEGTGQGCETDRCEIARTP